jgi:DNA-binding transcriptional regulator YdaS (Cro superfamily)
MNIRQLLKLHGAAAISAKLGVSDKTVWAWVRGDRRITAERAIQIEREFHVPRSSLRPDLWRSSNAD